ncbi:hypothetical protein INT44_006707 [Umbelopsis vinacea]|uniref:Uncharacterized protein n=1 Tax=Umbelopsis vinacea TaxID=44442 RepID=A0A8H7UCF5_9FUNG|nr:hypothetical protein INT44_006707 [Umbelopsis vinacea]
MEDIRAHIESEIETLQESHEHIKRQLEQNKKERLRKCREAGVLDHWRRLQKDRATLQRTRNNAWMRNNTATKSVDSGDPVVDGHPSNCLSNEDDSKKNEHSHRLHQDKSIDHSPHQEANTAEHPYTLGQDFHNDYSQHFVDTNERPQNFIRNTSLVDRFSEYPKLQELISAKEDVVKATASLPWALQVNLRKYKLQNLSCKFDVIVIDPPWEEYCRRSSVTAFSARDVWSYNDVANLDIEAVAANPSFIWIWCGNSQNVSRGRQLLMKWGYRRCEDLIWVKTNKHMKGSRNVNDGEVLQHTKEHCLMGIKGTVRRSTDGHFIHCNIDTDVIVSEEAPYNSTRKPEELYHIVEHFCLGTRRLELFGENHNLRPGWVTLGCDLSYSNFTPKAYLQQLSMNGRLLQSTSRIEDLRPKSPPPRDAQRKPVVQNTMYHIMPPMDHAPPPMLYPFPMPLPIPHPTMIPPHLMLPPW